MLLNSVPGEPELRAVTVRISGEVDIPEADQLRDAIVASASDSTTIVVLDLGDVTFLGSSGLSALVEAGRVLQARDVRLCIDECSDIAERVLEIAGVLNMFPRSTDVAAD